ncbi:MAG: hypothetical protein ACOCRD_05425 [Halorubrum sp.]
MTFNPDDATMSRRGLFRAGAGRDLSAGDIGALALGLGLAGSLLVPLFYAAHKMANDDA